MRVHGVLAVLVLCGAMAHAQDARETRVMAAVRAAMAPALPFPKSDDAGSLPADGNTEALWMVRPLEPADQTIEVIANPLNAVNQLRAARAMAQIENNIESAQRRAAEQYERAVAEAKRTGKSQEVDGVTLSDEGVAGAKIDADSHVSIDVAFNQPSYKFAVSSSIQPAASAQVTIPGAVAVIVVPSNTYRDERLGGDRYVEAGTLVFLGRVTAPEVQKRADHSYEVVAVATPPDSAAIASLVLRLRGNEVLIAELLRKTNWNALVELLK
jgi:hypothetical protein